MKLAAEWKPDCQGKQDFDGEILVLSTRYWPRGGGYMLLRNDGNGVRFEENAARSHMPPSAHSSLLLRDADNDDGVTLVEAEFEAETEAEVKAQVEAWAAEQFTKAVAALKAAFAAKGETT